jgi:predicted nucleic acid-binding protein
MTTCLDTNVIVALWDEEDELHRRARKALDDALANGQLVIAGAVYAELLAAPGRDDGFIDRFCADAGIRVEWEISEAVWREAGKAYQGYATRRRRRGEAGPRRILADFLIGAHALVRGYKLLTLDERMYRMAFPRLRIVSF